MRASSRTDESTTKPSLRPRSFTGPGHIPPRTTSFELTAGQSQARGQSFSQVEVLLSTSEKPWVSDKREVVEETGEGGDVVGRTNQDDVFNSLLQCLSDSRKRKVDGAAYNAEEACFVVVRAIAENLKLPKVVVTGCQAIPQIGGRDEQRLEDIGRKYRGIQTVLEAMRMHPQNAQVQESGLAALCAMTLAAPNRAVIRDLSGIETAIDAMRAHPTALLVQSEGCTLFANVAFGSPEAKLRLGSLGAIGAVLRAMRDHSHMGDVVLQTRACLALRNISWNAAENQQKIGLFDGIMQLILTMSRHHMNSAVVEQCVIALCNVVIECEANRARFTDTEGIEVVVSCMRAHQSNRIILEHGVALIVAVVKRSREVLTRVLNSRAVAVMLHSLSEHRANEDVVVKITTLLRYMAEFPAGRARIFQDGGIEALADALLYSLCLPDEDAMAA
eukprot:CAMPEP_0198315200 /NCGR_PEP_ID=MMETSP1450-20131203/5555_1 /TAXON_ID=753684 ORGANISM="Madagascaria erythrocladiodes, Strain CCMP3234" /NCGR_SAMPLE_ID=MMETSP1450 /ASSEMBLY_ACC=CAM_ASM_001115 /LENGTH=445 /DNA_ID=CAMNT_0044018301 /DNA_START=125 /DNA_END=1462 /DNA_ORIENTATION=-